MNEEFLKDLETSYHGKKHKYIENGLERLSAEDVEILVLYAMWTDGADAETVWEMKKEGLFKQREVAIRELVDHFGYLE